MGIPTATRISSILAACPRIAAVMEVVGVKRAARSSLRARMAQALTAEWAARVYRVPRDEFLATVCTASATKRGGA